MNFRIYIRKRLTDGSMSGELCVQDGFAGMREYMLLDSSLKKSANAAGSFECKLHPENVMLTTLDPDGKSWVEKANTRFIIKKFNSYDTSSEQGITIWDGRLLKADSDFDNQLKLYCEGAYAFLNDSIQPKKIFKYNAQTYPVPRYILEELLSNHNTKCPDKTIYASSTQTPVPYPDSFKTDGTIADGTVLFTVDNETTLSAVTRFFSTFGGNFRITYKRDNPSDLSQEEKRRLEWFETYDKKNNQESAIPSVTFGINLLDLSKTADATSLVTCVMPRGYKAYSAGDYGIGDDMFATDPDDPNHRSKVTWTSGAFLRKTTYTDGEGHSWENAVYEFPGTEHNTAATGFIDSDLAHDDDPDGPWGGNPPWGPTKPYPPRSLKVNAGDVYYVSLDQSDSRITYIVTANLMGTNPAWVVDSGTASNSLWPYDATGQNTTSYTQWRYNKITIKEPTDSLKERMQQDSYDLYLNISSRGYFSSYGDTEAGRGPMGLWKGRLIPEGLDEYITLKGLDDGSYDKFFYKVDNTQAIVTVASQADKNREIDFPPVSDKGTVTNYEDLPTTGVSLNDVYYVSSQDKRYAYNVNQSWDELTVSTAANLPNTSTVGLCYYVSDISKWYVYYGDAWRERRRFTRNGFYIYDNANIVKYGRVEKILDYNTVLDPNILENLSLIYLYNAAFEEFSLDVSAIDLALIHPEVGMTKALDILDPVRVTSTFHGTSGLLPIEELTIPFNNLGSMSFNVSASGTRKLTTETAKGIVT